jgi:hypothetical protein
MGVGAVVGGLRKEKNKKKKKKKKEKVVVVSGVGKLKVNKLEFTKETGLNCEARLRKKKRKKRKERKKKF